MAVAQPKKQAFLIKLGAHIAKLREREGITQTELGFRCDKDKQSIQRLEKGRMNPSAYYLSEIAEGLGIDQKELLNFKK
ncbi:MAG: helix-turn-helix transcriptional regulator [Lacibacter sp.]|jgi:transcriptional regulator with XRE-family HTH domain